MHVLSGPPCLSLTVESLGYLVPRIDFSGRVHSVFEQACNMVCETTNDRRLLTLCDSRASEGPTTLRLAVCETGDTGATGDLRQLFSAGEPLACRGGVLRTRHVELRLGYARVWRPVPPGTVAPGARVGANLRQACARWTSQRRHTSVVDREGVTVVAALGEACRKLDFECAARQVDRLIGWGEGLTPAGDDFLVGLLAALGALVQGDPRRRRFHDALAAVLSSSAQRTTPIAAHYLRLATGGHFTEPLLDLRNALLHAEQASRVEATLRCALAIGATSGADTVGGLLTGLEAWQPHSAGPQ